MPIFAVSNKTLIKTFKNGGNVKQRHTVMKTFEEIKNQLRENYNGYEDKENLSFAEWIDRESENDPDFFRWFYEDDNLPDFAAPRNLSDERYEQWNEFCQYVEDCDTYDVCFDDENNSNNEGFEISFRECLDYIRQYNGTDHSYFADYKGGTVSIYCNDTDEEVYHEEVK